MKLDSMEGPQMFTQCWLRRHVHTDHTARARSSESVSTLAKCHHLWVYLPSFVRKRGFERPGYSTSCFCLGMWQHHLILESLQVYEVAVLHQSRPSTCLSFVSQLCACHTSVVRHLHFHQLESGIEVFDHNCTELRWLDFQKCLRCAQSHAHLLEKGLS